MIKTDQKNLQSLRNYAFEHQQAKMKENAMQRHIAGWIKPTCEKMEEAIKIKNLEEA
jgi:hypothetical protein